MRTLPVVIVALGLFWAPFLRGAASFVAHEGGANDFALVREHAAAPIWFDGEHDAKVVSIAANDFAADVERVSGVKPEVSSTGRPLAGATSVAGVGDPGGPASPRPATVVVIGTLGHSALIDELARSGKLDAAALAGKWETFLIATVRDPFPQSAPAVKQALVIAGSDRRGTAFGVYELSQQIGVSPWYWWADVAPKKSDALFVRAGTHTMGPPSVKYRGIFINDEDWGLEPWAAKTFEPENGSIGPKTYQKVFELLLRLKANTLWPAMHACTKPFNSFPENAPLADDYAIVMGSSHAEPMLRNNVGEWPHDRAADYNYVTNRDGVLKYWEERMQTNGRFENIYTVGMRGIHDSNMQGPKTDAERIATLEKIFADQRALIAKYARGGSEVARDSGEASPASRLLQSAGDASAGVPQMFCAYKEVLDLYKQGLKVPDDVTIVWPDDNFGYVRNFATPEEQRTRTGGFGVYYHISYLGRPLAYLWLCTTPPSLIWEEMSKAYDHGARQIWIVNVGDIKPAEIDTEFFMQMAWDINRWNRDTLPNFLEAWATREFGAEHAKEIADIMHDYYQLNYQRKPEHLQWWLPNEKPRPSPLSAAEIESRLAAWESLRARVEALRAKLPSDGFRELVFYPVDGAALANQRFFAGERGDQDAAAFDAQLQKLAQFANDERAGGKWRGLVRLEPADGDWKSMRIAPWKMPEYSRSDADSGGTSSSSSAPTSAKGERPGWSRALQEVRGKAPGFVGFLESDGVISLEAEHFTAKSAGARASGRGDASWQIIPGLGRTGEGSVAIYPTTWRGVDASAVAGAAGPGSSASTRPATLSTDAPAPRLEYATYFFTPGEHTLTINFIPTFPIASDSGLRVAVALDEQAPEMIVVPRGGTDASGSAWAQGVLNATITGSAKIHVDAAGAHTLKIFGVDAGVVLDKIVIDCGGLAPSYLGPRETRILETTNPH